MNDGKTAINSTWQGWEELTPVLRHANFYDGAPGESFGPRIINDFQILFVQSGHGTARISGDQFGIGPGDLVFYGPNVIHTVTSSREAPLRLVGLHFVFRHEDSALAGRTSTQPMAAGLACFPFQPDCSLRPNPPPVISTGGSSGIRRLCEHLVMSFLLAPEGRPLEKRALLLQLFESLHERLQVAGTMAPLPENQRRLMELAEVQLRQNPANPPSTAVLAIAAGFKPDTFARLFKRHTGVSVHGYVLELRLQRAQELLVENRLSVNQVAEAIGFTDQFYFSRLFSRRFGVPPSRLRKRFQL